MKSRAALLFFALVLALNLSVQELRADPGAGTDLDPGVPFCSHISPLSSQRYGVNIEPHTSAVNFVLQWRDDASDLEIIIYSPNGREIMPEASPTFIRDKTSISFALPEPEAGRWIVSIKSSSLPSKGDDYCLSAKPLREGDDIAKARFSGLYRDYGVDDNGDGIDEYAVLKVGLNVKKSGDYSLEGSLYDLNDGRVIPVYTSAHLNFGSQFLEFQLDDMRTPGPYRLKGLVLYDENDDVMERSAGEYITKKYPGITMSGQETGKARINGNYSDYGLDINGDGLYDYLTIDVGVDVFVPDNYSLTGFLYDTSGRELVWSMGFGYLLPGTHTMHVDFDGKAIWQSKVNGPYGLSNLCLSRGDSVQNMTVEDAGIEAYTTKFYNYTEFVDPVWPERTISGSGIGEILLTISVKSVLPVYQGRYSYDIVGVQMPPISSNWTVKGSKHGYAYDLPGIFMPGKPNNFTITARGVKNLNVGVRKEQSAESGTDFFRTWVSSQAQANDDGVATLENDMISPGRYQFKVLGDAADNITQVILNMEVVKKLVINGDFTLAINTSGFPSGNYSINARAINGSFRLDEMSIEGLSMGF